MLTFAVTLFMFALSTVYWVASVINLTQSIQSIPVMSDPSEQSAHGMFRYQLLLNAIILINVSYKY